MSDCGLMPSKQFICQWKQVAFLLDDFHFVLDQYA